MSALSINDIVKTLALDAVHTSQPMQCLFGTVTGVEPLRIKIDDYEYLQEDDLILSNLVKDHSVDITVSMKTVDDNYLDVNAKKHTHGNGNNGNLTTGTADFDTTHHHDIKGKKKITFHYNLKNGEKVVLLRVQGGQKYFVVDRITNIATEGEWL